VALAVGMPFKARAVIINGFATHEALTIPFRIALTGIHVSLNLHFFPANSITKRHCIVGIVILVLFVKHYSASRRVHVAFRLRLPPRPDSSSRASMTGRTQLSV